MDFTALTDYLDSIPDFGAPGVDCMITLDGKPVYRHFSGLSDRENNVPMNGNELFYLFSCTKIITCVAALQLFEKGKFLLNDPVKDYLPEFSNMMVKVTHEDGTITIEKAEKDITIGDLFAMSAGLDYELESPEILEAIRNNPHASTREIVKAIAKKPLIFEPGTHYFYSLCHDVLGALIEVLSGKSFGEYLEENIFAPLGMKNTGFSQTDTITGRMMQQYTRDEITGEINLMPLINNYVLTDAYESGGAGLISSVEDYSKFVTMLANGGKTPSGKSMISPATIELMRTQRITTEQIIELSGWTHLLGYGYGLGVRTLTNRAISGSLSPIGEFGWTGAAGALALIDPENHLGIFYTQHVRNSISRTIHPRLRNIIYAAITKGE